MTESQGSGSVLRAERPRFTPGYGISTEVEGLLDWSWADDRLARSRSYWVCTAGAEGLPHAAPVWGVWRDSTFYFSTDPRSRKAKNISAQPHIVVHLESGDEVVILEGRPAPFHDVRDVPGLAKDYENKYGFDVTTMPAESALWIALKPSIVHGWREADFPTSATRWVFTSD
jgi:hypothetical protein